MSILNNFDGWKEFLGNRIQNAEQSGMSEDTMNHLAGEIGDYLASNVDPKNDEQRLLSDLWKAADENQQQALAGAMINMVKNQT
ncbi:MAG TPA: DUF3243 domain-containing protein [Bacillota bacterium]|nr:DUF3243 domain-containing protein [Bacillota bacterium]